MPEGVSEMSRFSKVSSIFGRDAFATMRYVTLLNVSEIRDISNDERKVPFKNDDYLASGMSSSDADLMLLSPDESATRAQVAVMLQNFAEKYL